MRRRALSGALLLSGILLLAAAPAVTALTIDDFESGDFSVTDDTTAGTPTFAEQSGLPTSSVAGRVRLVRAFASGANGSTTAILTTTPADDAAALAYVGTDGAGEVGFFYDGIANGASDGTGGALNLDLTPFQSIEVGVLGTAASATLRLRLWNASVTQVGTIPLATGTNTFLLDDFTLNRTSIRALRLDVQNLALLDAVTLSDISAVPIPEPGTAALLGLGLGMAALAGRLSRGRWAGRAGASRW